jgi:hypothetical protein
MRPISFLSKMGKLFQKAVLHTVQRHGENMNLLHASQFGFRARHSTTFQCETCGPRDPNSNNDVSMATIFLDIEKVSDTTWHPGLFV